MSDDRSPRAAGFNYGEGWGKEPKPAIYFIGVAKAHLLRKKAAEASRISWEMDMAVRDVQLAETGVEKARALARLADAIADDESTKH